jgi:hypothetical protein
MRRYEVTYKVVVSAGDSVSPEEAALLVSYAIWTMEDDYDVEVLGAELLDTQEVK